MAEKLGKDIIDQLKRDGALCLPVSGFDHAFLRPVICIKDDQNTHDVDRLTRWRNDHVKSFLTEFNATNVQTSNWLAHAVLENSGKILFMVDFEDNTVGHVGLGFADWANSYIEADAIVRGVDAPRGLMKQSLLTLLRWARDELGLDDQWVRVRSDNPACAFYRKVGFVDQKQVPLNQEQQGDMLVWFEDPALSAAQAYLVYMKHDANYLDDHG